MRRSIRHTMCNKAAVLSCAARGETVLSLPPEAPRLCLRRRRANALCDLPVQTALHGCIAAAARAAAVRMNLVCSKKKQSERIFIQYSKFRSFCATIASAVDDAALRVERLPGGVRWRRRVAASGGRSRRLYTIVWGMPCACTRRSTPRQRRVHALRMHAGTPRARRPGVHARCTHTCVSARRARRHCLRW